MDIDRFITLQTVVEEGSFARAANKLCCTQSTVTYHIKELEQYRALAMVDSNLVSLCEACHNKMHPGKGGSRGRKRE